MLTAERNAGRLFTRFDDTVDEAWKWGNGADEEGRNGAPVAGVFRRVTVHAVEVVHVRNGDISSADDEVAAGRIG